MYTVTIYMTGMTHSLACGSEKWDQKLTFHLRWKCEWAREPHFSL